MNYLASPPLVVAYAINGDMDWDPYREPIGKDQEGKDVFLKIFGLPTKKWPQPCTRPFQVICLQKLTQMFLRAMKIGVVCKLGAAKPFILGMQIPPILNTSYFEGKTKQPAPIKDIHNARILALLGDSVTTDHISPAGSIKASSPAGKYLQSLGVKPDDFNSYGARRGNHEAMVRGTFANIRIKNMMLNGVEGGLTSTSLKANR